MLSALHLLCVLVGTLTILRPAESGYYNDYDNEVYDYYRQESSNQVNSQSNVPYECKEEGFHEDPNNCRVFYRCVDWGNGSPLTAFKAECGEGTVFSKSKGNVCVFPNDSGRAECCEPSNEIDSNDNGWNQKPQPEEQQKPSYPPQGQRPDKPSYPPHSSSPRPSYPPPPTEKPQHPSYLPPSKTPVPPTSPAPQKPDKPSTDGCKPDSNGNPSCASSPGCTDEGYFPNPDDCHKFYRCVKENSRLQRYDFECGTGTAWDQDLKGCDYEDNVASCGSSPSEGPPKPTSSPTPSTPEPSSRPTKDPTGTPYPTRPTQGTTQGPYPSTHKPYPPWPTKSTTQKPYPTTQKPYPPWPTKSTTQKPYPTKETPYPTKGTPYPTKETPYPTKETPYPTKGTPYPTKETPYPTKETPYPTTRPTEGPPPPTSNPPDWSSSATPDEKKPCPAGSSEGCTEEGFFPNPQNCHKFYRCSNEGGLCRKYDFECGTGTAWDQQLQTCNFENDVASCNGNKPPGSSKPCTDPNETTTSSTTPPCTPSTSTAPEPTPTKSTLPPDPSTPSPPSSTTTPQPTDSTTKSDNKTSITTPQPTESTTTSESTTSTTTPQPTGSTPRPESTTLGTSKGDCQAEGFFPNPDDCHKFYRCVSNPPGYIKYDFDCGPGTAWDQSLLTCNHIDQVASCGSNTSPTSPKPPIPSTPDCHPTNATTTPQPTPSSSTPTPTPKVDTTTTPLPTTQPPPSSPSPSPSPTTTTTIKPLPTTQPPPSSPSPSPSPTTTTTITPTPTTQPPPSSPSPTPTTKAPDNSSSTAKPDCETPKPNNTIVCDAPGFYPHPTRCDKFYRCVDNGNGFNVYHFDCGPGTIFDPSINVCNHPENVYPARNCEYPGSSTTSEPTPTTQSSTTPRPTTTTLPSEPTTPVPSTTPSPTESTTPVPTTTTSPSESTTPIPTTTSPGESTTPGPTTTTSPSESTTPIPTTTSPGESTTPGPTTTTSPSESTTPIPTTTSPGESTTPGPTTTTSPSESTTPIPTTPEPTTTPSPTSTDTTTTEQSTSPTTNNPPTDETTTTSPTTQPPPSSEKPPITDCPVPTNLTDEQIVLVCPTGFKRHPKLCNLFYQCTQSGNMEVKILILQCPNGTIFDEKECKCLPESESTQTCNGAIAGKRIQRRVANESPLVEVSTKPLCPEEGHFPYRDGCSNVFYKCKRDSRYDLQGFLYKCPKDFVYWSVSRRCERASRLPMCTSMSNETEDENEAWEKRWEIPVEDRNLSARSLLLY